MEIAMKRHPMLLLLCALILALSGRAIGQVEITGAVGEASRSFVLDALSFAGDSAHSRLDVFIQVGYDNLTFVKDGDSYGASYELTTTLYDSTNGVIDESSNNEQVSGVTFDQSVAANAFKVTQKVFRVAPGHYAIGVQLRDNESKGVRRLQRPVNVPDFTRGSFALSDIMLVSRIVQQGDRKTIVPNITSNVGNLPDAFYVFMEAYGRRAADSIRFRATVSGEKGEEFLKTDSVQYIRPGRNEVFMRIDNSHLPLGDFRLMVTAVPVKGAPEDSRLVLAGTGRGFIVRWRGLPLGLKNLDKAIEQLRYIAKEGEISKMEDAPSIEEKQKLFLEFWKKRDPNPNTPRNEKMEQYYTRVDYANKHFSHFMEGWRTDMGMVYITFGPPNNVERHPFDIDSKPYEVWGYYDLNYQFVFVDQTGFGDYRLVTPIWETLGHIREQ
jgi:GWxTD domain-containing protein